MRSFLDRCKTVKPVKKNVNLDFDIDSMRFLRKRERNQRKLELIKKYQIICMKMIESEHLEDERLLAFWVIWHFDCGMKKEFFDLSKKAIGLGIKAVEGFTRSFEEIRRSFSLKYQKYLREKNDFSFKQEFIFILNNCSSEIFRNDVSFFLKELFYIAIFDKDLISLNAIYNIESSGDLDKRIGVKTIFEKEKITKITCEKVIMKEKKLRAMFDV